MYRNYIKIAWRNLMRNKIFSFINIIGLAVGLTCCMLIAFYLDHELSYDSGFTHAAQLYQLGTEVRSQSGTRKIGGASAPMAATMQRDFPEISKSTRLIKAFQDDKTLLQYDAPSSARRSFYETKGYLADSNFFQLFTYKFKEGFADNALLEPNTVVLSEEIANKLFGSEPALNKVIHISSSTNGDHDFKVTGVFLPSATPSHIDARFFMSINGGGLEALSRRADYASNNMFFTYFLLQPGAEPKRLEAKFPAFISKYAGQQLKATGFSKSSFLVPVEKIHLYDPEMSNVTPGGSTTYLYILGSIALFTLLIACINFMNLATARSAKRSAEVGVRKVLGAERTSLVAQFLGESVVMALVAFVFAVGFTLLLLPLFSRVSGAQIVLSLARQGWMLAAFFGLALLTGVCAGLYPAFYLSSFKPVRVLKGKFKNSFAAVSLRRGLVVVQFVISVVLIIASVVIRDQMRYMRNKDLGFAKADQIVLPLRSETAKALYPALKSEAQSLTQVAEAGASYFYPGIMNASDMSIHAEGASANDSKRVYMNWVDESFLQTLGTQVEAGRIFSKDFPGDTAGSIVLNDQGVRQFGFRSAEDALNKRLQFDWQGQVYNYTIIGVLKDFHFQDLHLSIEPYGFQLNNAPTYSYLIIHARPGQGSAVLKSMETAWHRLNPNEPFEYSFLDEDFARNYAADDRLASIVGAFTLIAIAISCLGLFGLAAFIAEQKMREIGIRKVLGASMGNIVTLLSGDFVKLILVAVVVASPLAWYVMHRWLSEFAYRISIGWWMFVLAAALALLIALLTISIQAIRAAVSNPVDNLRTE